MLDFDDAPKACLAFEVVDAGAPKAIGDGGAVLCIVKAVGQRPLSLLLNYLACFVVDIKHGWPAFVGMCNHASQQLGMVLKGSISIAVAAIDGDEFAPWTVFVTSQWMMGQVWLIRIMGQIYRHQPHATISPPAPRTLGCETRQGFEL